MVLSFSKAADAMMFSVGWQAVEMTTSGRKIDTGGKYVHMTLYIHLDLNMCIHFNSFALREKKKQLSKPACVSSTCVALQFLHDLLRLQVPDIHHVVL